MPLEIIRGSRGYERILLICIICRYVKIGICPFKSILLNDARLIGSHGTAPYGSSLIHTDKLLFTFTAPLNSFKFVRVSRRVRGAANLPGSVRRTLTEHCCWYLKKWNFRIVRIIFCGYSKLWSRDTWHNAKSDHIVDVFTGRGDRIKLIPFALC